MNMNGGMHLNGGMNLNGVGTFQVPTSMPSLNGVNGLNALNFGMMEPLLMAGGMPHHAISQSAANFTGKVRVGVAAVKTGSPKFAPY